MVEIAVAVARGRVPVIAGAGSNSTAEAIDLTRHAKEAGADAALVVTPYYNKPTQEGLYLHFTAIADAVDLPIIIYNIPPRSVVDMSVETMARLAKHPNIVGVKDATANLARPLHTRRACGAGLLPACPARTTPRWRSSPPAAIGCISVTANVAPAAVQRDARGLAGRPGRRGDGDPGPAGAAARRAVRRDQPRPGEIRRQPARPRHADHCRLPLAPIAERDARRACAPR